VTLELIALKETRHQIDIRSLLVQRRNDGHAGRGSEKDRGNHRLIRYRPAK